MNPIVVADQPKIQLRSAATINPKQRGWKIGIPFFRPEDHDPDHHQPDQNGLQVGSEAAVEISDQFLRGGFRGGRFDSEQVVGLADDDNERDAERKSANDRRGDKSGEAPEAHQPDGEHQQA